MAVQPTDAARQGEDRSCCKQNNQKPSPGASTAQGICLSPTPPTIDAGTHDCQAKALSLCAIRQLAPMAVAGPSAGISVRGLRVLRKRAGIVCRRAQGELGPAGLLWSEAAWVGSLRAAMGGLKGLANLPDVDLLSGFEEVLASVKRSHLEGLKQPAGVSRRFRKAGRQTSSCPRPAARSAERKAAQRLARSLCEPEDTVPYALYCHECGAGADCGLRGSKEGGEVKYVCNEHADSYRYFSIDKDRAALGRAKAKVVGKKDVASPAGDQTRSQSACNNTFQRSGLYYDAAPKSRRLTATLLIIGGIEPNPGWGPDEVSAQGKSAPGHDIGTSRPLIPLPSLEEVYGKPLLSESTYPLFEDWRKRARLSKQVGISCAALEGGVASGEYDRTGRPESAEEMPSLDRELVDEELSHLDRIEEGLLTALVENNGGDERSQLSTSLREVSGAVNENKGCGAAAKISRGNKRSAAIAASESDSEQSGSEEGEDIEGAEFESVDESSDGETSQDRRMIDDGSQDEENPVIAQGKMRAAGNFDHEPDIAQLLAGRFKPQAPRQATKALQTGRQDRLLPSRSKSAADGGSPSRSSCSTASDGRWVGAQVDQQPPAAASAGLLPLRSGSLQSEELEKDDFDVAWTHPGDDSCGSGEEEAVESGRLRRLRVVSDESEEERPIPRQGRKVVLSRSPSAEDLLAEPASTAPAQGNQESEGTEGDGEDVRQQPRWMSAADLHDDGPSSDRVHPAREPHSAAAELAPLVRSREEGAGGSPSVARRPVKKKPRKRTKPSPAPMDEATRTAGQAALQAHFRNLRESRLHGTWQEGQVVQLTDPGDPGDSLHAPDAVLDEEARPSTSLAPRTGRPAQKKRSKRAKPSPAPLDEAARAANRVAVEAHFGALERSRPHRIRHEGQAVHRAESSDLGGPHHAVAAARPMLEALGAEEQIAQEAAAVEAHVDAAQNDIEGQQEREHSEMAMQQHVLQSPQEQETLGDAEEPEAPQQIWGVPAEDVGNATSSPASAELCQPSTAPDLDEPAQSGNWVSTEDGATELLSQSLKPPSSVNSFSRMSLWWRPPLECALARLWSTASTTENC
ncbi:hypothetical protein KFL_007110020 [Klebsormidium nitens]|uniref:Uncharacterized protein n=1 Tax=Klebsormidium nitens TaxID=105231 RepID=A0A1Y1INF1_KLENI|nr:hypothetical protein KFL_007110020 [Klebsormidium nitens]|eukprot:GAQ90989.1 hypothetical protein KFL_007110020 [Klebsormidium nitens]